MDIEKMIEGYEQCGERYTCVGCPAKPDSGGCMINVAPAMAIRKVRDRYENLLIKQSEFNDRVNGQLIQDRWNEWSRVIAEIREIIKDNTIEILDAGHFTRSVVEAEEVLDMIDSIEPDNQLLEKLDELEPDKGVTP